MTRYLKDSPSHQPHPGPSTPVWWTPKATRTDQYAWIANDSTQLSALIAEHCIRGDAITVVNALDGYRLVVVRETAL